MKHRMTLWKSSVLMLCLWTGCILQGGQVSHQPRKADPATVPAGKPAVSYAKLPLSFEANQGQTDQSVEFLSHGRGYALFLTGNEAVLSLRRPSSVVRAPLPMRGGIHDVLPNSEPRTPDAVLRMRLVGANANAAITGGDELPGKANYFIGNDPKKWRTNVPTYAQVRYRNVYPGIDLVYYGSQGGQLEYDFVVAPGADPSSILFAVDAAGRANSKQKAAGSAQPKVDSDGDLVVLIDGEREVRFHKPLVYQPDAGSALATGHLPLVQAHYVLAASNQVRFEVGPYDHTRLLVIDPVLVYSTYLGGSDLDAGNGIAVDSSGNAYVTGVTRSSDFPIANPLQASLAGTGNAFVAKFNAVGSALVYSTYLGGSNYDAGWGIAVDSSGDAYVTGSTTSPNFPTANPLQGSVGPGICGTAPDTYVCSEAFVTKLNPSGSALVYSTYLGGSGGDGGNGIAVDSSGSAYVTGGTGSTNFPTVNPLQANLAGSGNAFVAKFNAAGSALAYSTYLGGSDQDFGWGIAVDSSGDAYLTGSTWSADFPTAHPLQPTCASCSVHQPDAFVAELNAAGSALVYSTYLGGSDQDFGWGIAVDSSGNAYVTGSTNSSDFPTFNPLQGSWGGAFVAKFNAPGSAMVYSTYLPGTDFGYGIAVDSSGNAYAVGQTCLTNFLTVNPIQASLGAPGACNAFVAKLNPAGSAFVYSTYLGGIGIDTGYRIAVDSSGDAYLTGSTSSADFPTAHPLQAGLSGISSAFVAKISAPPVPGVTFSTNILTFGSELEGTTSPVQSVALTNSGTASLNIASINISGDFAFATTGTSCPYTGGTVASGDTCTLDVTFTPTATGLLTGLVTITDNDNGVAGSTQTISLTGTGTASVASVSTTSLTFSGQTVGTTSAAQPVTLSNTGSAALTISSIGISGNFAQTNNCGGSVAVNGSCTINVTFTPTVGGTRTGTLTVTDNSNGAAGSTQTVNLTGTGQDFTLMLATGSPASTTISRGGTATYTLSAASLGGFSQAVNLSCSGAPSEATCQPSQTSVTPSSSGTNFTLTVTTTAPSASGPRSRPHPPTPPVLPGPSNLAMLALILGGLAWTVRGWRRRCGSRLGAALVTSAMGLLLVLMATACGGGGGSGGGSSTNLGTPAGTYTLTVTGTAGSGSAALSHSVTLTLTVS